MDEPILAHILDLLIHSQPVIAQVHVSVHRAPAPLHGSLLVLLDPLAVRVELEKAVVLAHLVEFVVVLVTDQVFVDVKIIVGVLILDHLLIAHHASQVKLLCRLLLLLLLLLVQKLTKNRTKIVELVQLRIGSLLG